MSLLPTTDRKITSKEHTLQELPASLIDSLAVAAFVAVFGLGCLIYACSQCRTRRWCNINLLVAALIGPLAVIQIVWINGWTLFWAGIGTWAQKPIFGWAVVALVGIAATSPLLSLWVLWQDRRARKASYGLVIGIRGYSDLGSDHS